MHKDIKARWVARLRELPNDRQGTNYLYNEDTGKMCCLGVLCEMAAEEGAVETKVDSWARVDNTSVNVRGYGEQNALAGLPLEVQMWAGLNDELPAVNYNENGQNNLGWINDNEGKTFDDIADLIEADERL